jgi:alpha-tubulin suppressor-like RCC1 family protein
MSTLQTTQAPPSDLTTTAATSENQSSAVIETQPTASIESTNVVSWTIATGYNHTLALREDGTVLATGNNGEGKCNVSDRSRIKIA